MKLTLVFGFTGGQLQAEVTNIAELDDVLAYALQRGILSNGPTTPAEQPAPPSPEEPVEEPVEDEEPITVEQAQAAIKAFAAKHGIEAGRGVLGRFGLKRTNEILGEHAAAIVEACHE
jgi:hypothetical protein